MILENIINSLLNFIPEIILSIMAMVVLLFGIFKTTKHYIFATTLLSVFLALLVSIKYFPQDNLYLFNYSIVKNELTEFFKYICYIIFILQIIISRKYLEERKLFSGEFYSLLIFAFLGCLIIISSNNLIILFLGIELSSLSLYSLIALNRNSIFSSEAAIKYFVLSIIASAIILFGFSYLYGITNSIIISDIVAYPNKFQVSNLYLFSYVLIFIGVAFKFAVAPFHLWLPDVYEGAPIPITNFISSIPKIAFFVFAYRFLDKNDIFQNENFYNLILILGVFSIFIGNIFALAQRKILRMLAYSSIANSGFIFIALYTAKDFNFSVSAFYVIVYSFTIVSSLSIITFLSSKKFDLVYIDDLKGLSSNAGFISLLLMVTMLSSAGIPLTVGFYAKYLVLDALISSGLVYVAVITVLMTVVGLYYYLRIIWFMFFEQGSNSLINLGGRFHILTLSIIPILLFIIFLLPNTFFKYFFNILA